MTPNEVTLLRQAGKTLLYRDLATPLIAFLFYGVSLPLIVYASFLLRSNWYNNRPSSILYYATIICLLFLTTHFAGEATKISMDFDLARALSHSGGDLSVLSKDLAYINDRNWNPVLLRNWVDSIGLIISDVVVIWRAWVLLPSRQAWMIVLPIFLLFSSAVLSITACVLGSTVKGSQLAGSPRKTQFNTLTEVSYFLSLASNILATSVFGYRLLRLRELYPISDGGRKLSSSSVQQALWLLVESGVLFCISQIAVIAILLMVILGRIKTLSETLAFDIITRFQYSLSIVYPILVVVLVRTRNSAADIHLEMARVESSQTHDDVELTSVLSSHKDLNGSGNHIVH